MKEPNKFIRTAVVATTLSALLITGVAAACIPAEQSLRGVSATQVTSSIGTNVLLSKSVDAELLESQGLGTTYVSESLRVKSYVTLESTDSTITVDGQTSAVTGAAVDLEAMDAMADETVVAKRYGVATSLMPIYTDRSTSAEALDWLSEGTLFVISAEYGDGWYLVGWEDIVGYTHIDYMEADVDRSAVYAEAEANAYEAYDEGTYGMASVSLRLRAEESVESSYSTLLYPGDVAQLISYQNGWYYVYFKGEYGYIYSDYVTFGVNKPDWKASEEYAAQAEAERIAQEEAARIAAEQTAAEQEEAARIAAEQAAAQAEADRIAAEQAEAERIAAEQAAQEAAQQQQQQTSSEGSSSSNSSSSSSSDLSDVIATAKNYLGCTYVWAADGPSTFDCSGFTMYVYAQYGVSLPHNAAMQLGYGTSVSYDNLQPGDLVFFKHNTTKAASHVGIYIGDGDFIHASSGKGCVTISSLNENWYSTYYVGARRVA